MLILLASAARTASGDSGALSTVPRPESIVCATFTLDVTAAASASGDLLDVYIQSSVDGGTTWDDFVHFTQVLGNGGAKRFRAKWHRDLVATTPLGPQKDATLAAGVEQGPVGSTWRVKYVVTNGAGTHSFTFSVSALIQRAQR